VKAAGFEYHRPETTAGAIELLEAHGDAAKALAGGQSLVPMLTLRLARFEHLVDLNRIPELRGVHRDNGEVRIGAMTRQATIERDPGLATEVPLLARSTPLIGHFQIRNRGTIGGSLAHADPAAEYPAVAAALDARLEVEGPGGSTRLVAAEDFFRSTWTTSLASEELLTAVRFPVWGGRCGFAVEELARRYGDFAVVGTACAVCVQDGRVVKAGLSMFGVGEKPVRLHQGEAALVDAGSRAYENGTLREICGHAVDHLDPPGDVHASKGYRKRVASVVLARALERALTEARSDG
jgi:aerobic carbon-monoxide dehydrogenase medium subunit